ncbi:LOT5 Protein LOT5 [Candida maltosa Xu316]|uniref:Protein LOT5 n=1 Tax=Candida maltosa (strain Xu316) TaxID=1245528 RepID=M3J433_CANMX|nr:Protein LOT5 [Candida maltosa Xu316]
MNQPVRLIHDQPDVENTIPYVLYQSSSPNLNFIEEDKLILYGGGDKFTITTDSPSLSIDLSSVVLFVLNSSVVIWSNQSNVGVEITYPSIIFHGINEDFIYLSIKDNALLGNNIVIRYNSTPSGTTNPLFNSIVQSLQEVYGAISAVSNLYVCESDDDDEEDQVYTHDNLPALDLSQTMDQTPKIIKNSGQADDLDDDLDDENNDYVAAMNIDVGYGSIVGVKTRRDSEDQSHQDVHQKRSKLV